MQSLPLSCKPMTMQITWAVRSSRPPRATLIIIATTLAQQYKIMQCLFALSYSNLNLTCSSLIKMRLQAGVKQHNKLAVQFVSFPKSVTSLHPSIFFFFPFSFLPSSPRLVVADNQPFLSLALLEAFSEKKPPATKSLLTREWITECWVSFYNFYGIIS